MLTLSLFAYVAMVFIAQVRWGEVLKHTVMPSISIKTEYVVAVVAVFGTTIRPYLFFWQASQEVEELRAVDGDEPLRKAPQQARAHLRRIKIDTYLGMGFSNLIAFFVSTRLRILGWMATGVMALAVLGMGRTSLL
jgi:Mn2+/Fe2+ NRAMP family transporter